MSVRTPRLKILRRLGVALPGLTRKDVPAARPVTRAVARKRRPSAYRLALEEKQKVRFNYGVTERQMRRYLDAARRMPGDTGQNLLALLERRLDNVVFRLGFAPTIPAARQLVVHGHVRVGERRVDRPGYLVRVGDTIALSPRSREREALRTTAELGPVLRVPGHLRRDPDDPFTGRAIAPPARADVPFPLRESLIIELYAR